MKKFLSALLLVCALAAVFAGCNKESVTVTGGVPESFDGFVTLVLDDPDTEGADAFSGNVYKFFGRFHGVRSVENAFGRGQNLL